MRPAGSLSGTGFALFCRQFIYCVYATRVILTIERESHGPPVFPFACWPSAHHCLFHTMFVFPMDIGAAGALCLQCCLLEQRHVQALFHLAPLHGLMLIIIMQLLMFSSQMLMNASSLDKKSVKMASVWIRSQVMSATANRARTMTLLSSSALVSLFKVVLSL